jgi:hypothetical protein
LAHRDAAVHVLTSAGINPVAAEGLVVAGAIADLTLGALVCVRRTAALAFVGMLAVTAAYLLSATIVRPDLWGDPLGPLVKTLPAALLALTGLALLAER